MKLYALRLNEDIDFAKNLGKLMLPKSIQDRLSKKVGKARSRSALAYLFLRYCLIREGKGESFDRIEFSANGKPYAEGVYFSLSHTDGMIACAVAEVDVGVDVERIKAIPESTARRCLDETGFIKMQTAEDKNLFVLTQWVIKEAWLKELGKGISVELKSIAPSQISEHVFQIDGHSVAVYREGELVIALSTKGELPKEIISTRINDII